MTHTHKKKKKKKKKKIQAMGSVELKKINTRPSFPPLVNLKECFCDIIDVCFCFGNIVYVFGNDYKGSDPG